MADFIVALSLISAVMKFKETNGNSLESYTLLFKAEEKLEKAIRKYSKKMEENKMVADLSEEMHKFAVQSSEKLEGLFNEFNVDEQ
jgi:ribosome-associated translation inhibitor RaiA